MLAASACLYVDPPHASRLGYARAPLDAGCSVFCEKLLAVDLAVARAFVTAVCDRGAVNFPFVCFRPSPRCDEWLAEGAVGTPGRVTIEVAFASRSRSWQVDAARWLNGRAEGGFTREVVSHFCS